MLTLRRKLITLAACALALAAHVGAGMRFGLTPAVGMLLSPFEGFWQNADPLQRDNVPTLLPVKGLKASVTIRFDSALVPHIEAKQPADLFYAQGYVCAALRLWQMDFISRAAAGRISEIVGERALEYDRFQRRFGMGMAAAAALDSMMADPYTKLALESYAAGANTYLAHLDPRQIPLEYKVLGYKPESWTPLKTAYLLKYMAYSLSGHTDEAAMSRALALLGPTGIAQLYPSMQSQGVPVMPAGTVYKGTPIAMPALDTTSLYSLGEELLLQADRRNGSNNWALAGSRTASGKPLLANDPHLGLHLPSLWIRMQLHGPGMDVQGMTLPGAPGIIIGHNQAIAWGVTNTDADVLDLYAVKRMGPDHYLYQGKRRAFRKVVETIGLAGNNVVLDTVLYTELGPIASTKSIDKEDIPEDMAVSWAAHQPSNDLAAFLGLARAHTVLQAENALSHLACPAQNVAYADTAGNIGLFIAGSLPLKAPDQGKFAQRAEGFSVRPIRFIPSSHNPQSINPAQEFVASANQQSTDKTYPYYINWRQSEPDRGNRIATRISAMHSATIDTMAALQMDDYSLLAARFLPRMLAGINTKLLSLPEQEIYELVCTWNLRYDSSLAEPAVFDTWFHILEDSVWSTLRARHLPLPAHSVFYQILVGDKVNPVANLYEVDAKALYLATFKKACQQLTTTYGAAGKAWSWGRVKRTQLRHMARIPGLSLPFVSASGGPGVVNATGNNHGPSMRMIVDLQPPVRAYGNMPGGQSGNPGSPYYITGLEDWRKGRPTPWRDYRPGQKRYPGLMTIWELRPR